MRWLILTQSSDTRSESGLQGSAGDRPHSWDLEDQSAHGGMPTSSATNCLAEDEVECVF